MSTAMRESTPIFDELITAKGNPIVRPAVDRSYAALVNLATRKGKKTSLKSVPEAKVPKSTTEQNSDQNTGQVENDADAGTARKAPAPKARAHR